MPIVVTCPSCSTSLKAPDAAAGRRVKCPKCTSPIDVPASSPPFVEEAIAADEPAPAPRAPAGYAGAPPMGQINRQTIGMLAILIPIGALGIHKFILGKNTPGLIMLLVSLFGCGIGYVVMLVIGILEGIKYLRMSDAEFYETYVAGNKAWL